MVDLVIRGDCVVTPHDTGAYDVAIEGERIVAVSPAGAYAGSRACQADRRHGQDRHPRRHRPACALQVAAAQPGRHGPDDRAAGRGQPGGAVRRHHDADRLRLRLAGPLGAGRDRAARAGLEGRSAACDYALSPDGRGRAAARLAGPARRGDPGRLSHGQDLHHRHLAQRARAAWSTSATSGRCSRCSPQTGGLGVIHAEDNDIVMHMYAKLIREGRVGFENMAEVHNTLSEDLSFRRVIRLAESVPGTALYMMHVSRRAPASRAIREARAQGPADLRRDAAPVHAVHGRGLQAAERADLSHLSVAEVARGPGGAVGAARSTARSTASPPTSCAARCSEKLQGKRIDDTTGGNAGVEPRVALMYTEMVGSRGYSLRALRRPGLDQRRARSWASIRARARSRSGSDADIVRARPGARRKVRAADLHETDYTPWEGHEIRAWPGMTILRGKVMVENGAYSGDLADGRWLERRIDDAIIAGPRL